MKNLTLILSLIFAQFIFANSISESYLRDFTSGAFRPQTMAALYSMNDGENYTMLSEDGTKIVKYNYLSGKAVDTIFDVATAKSQTCGFITSIDDATPEYAE